MAKKEIWIMKKIDRKHTAFHVLVGLYFIWVAVFGLLMLLALINFYGDNNIALTKLFIGYIVMNLITGSALFVVIKLFRQASVLSKVIFWSYVVMGVASVITVAIIRI